MRLAALVLLATLTSIGAPTEAAADEGLTPGLPFCGNDLIITPGKGIGPLVIGMPEAAADAMFNITRGLAIVSGGRSPALHQVTYDGGPGRGVAFLAKDSRVQAAGVAMYALASIGCHTAEGVSPGSTAADVSKAYGPPPLTRPLPSPLTGEAWIYDSAGIAFHIAPYNGTDTVNVIWVFAPGTYCQLFPTVC